MSNFMASKTFYFGFPKQLKNIYLVEMVLEFYSLQSTHDIFSNRLSKLKNIQYFKISKEIAFL